MQDVSSLSRLVERRHFAQTASTMPKDTMPPCAIPKESKRDLRPDNAREAGKLGGCPKGTEKANKLTFPTEEERSALAAQMASRVLETGSTGIRTDSRLGPVTNDDRRVLRRLTGWTQDEFNRELSTHLADFSAEVLNEMRSQLRAGKYKPSELNFAFAVSEDKRARLDGRSSLQNASVNIQVNNYGEKTDKDSLIRSILGDGKAVAIGETLEVVG